jgi:hypothetical protein
VLGAFITCGGCVNGDGGVVAGGVVAGGVVVGGVTVGGVVGRVGGVGVAGGRSGSV